MHHRVVLGSGTVLWAPETERLWGLRPGEFRGTYEHWQTLVHPEDLPQAETLANKALDDPTAPYEFEHRIIRPDGSVRWIYSKATTIRDVAGKPVRMVGLNMDITARKQAEVALQQRTAELTAANKELEAFAYSVSHDLRAPLRATEGFSRIVQEKYGDKLDTIGREYLQEVRTASVQMGHLIDDLLKLSRITRVEMTRQPVNLSDLARNVMTHLHQHDPSRQVEVMIADGLVTEGDARLLRVVLDNLLGNAWKFTGKSGHPRIEFGQAEQNAHPVFFVRDNGAGFDMAYARKLFHAFQRLHSVSEFEGTGIGLATVQRVIHRHGGRVWAEGAVNQGATFYFTLWERTHHEPPNHSAR